MTFKILSLLAMIGTFATVSAPASANDEAVATNRDEATATTQPDADYYPSNPYRCEPWMRDCNPYYNRGAVVCYARNAIGRTFSAVASYRTPRWWIQQRAVENCRRGSFFILGRTCRPIGCRYMNGYYGGYNGGYGGGWR